MLLATEAIAIVLIRLSLLNGVTFSSSRLADQPPPLLPATGLSIITAREDRWNQVAIADTERLAKRIFFVKIYI
jgi:hypothetical protein